MQLYSSICKGFIFEGSVYSVIWSLEKFLSCSLHSCYLNMSVKLTCGEMKVQLCAFLSLALDQGKFCFTLLSPYPQAEMVTGNQWVGRLGGGEHLNKRINKEKCDWSLNHSSVRESYKPSVHKQIHQHILTGSRRICSILFASLLLLKESWSSVRGGLCQELISRFYRWRWSRAAITGELYTNCTRPSPEACILSL
jgi:hypothetical protein